MQRSLSVNAQVALCACAVVGVGLVYLPSFASMADSWSTDAYRHSYTVPLIFCYLVYLQRSSAAEVTWQPSFAGLVLVAAFVLAWVIGVLSATRILEHLSVIGLMSAALIAVCGWRMYRQFMFPMLFLVFLVPMGEAAIPPLMRVTADISGNVVSMLGVPVFRDGTYLQLPGGRFEVASACSGFRYLNAGLVIGLVAAKLFFDHWKHRLAYVALVMTAFVLINGLRAAIVMIVASASDMTLLVGDDHIIFGWVLFAAALFAMLYLGDRLSLRWSRP